MASKNWNGGSGDYATAANWTPVGAPGTADVAIFATGTSTPYTVSGSGTTGGIEIDGDQVVLSGSLTTLGGPFNAANYSTSSGVIREGGQLTLAAGAALTGSDTFFVGDYVNGVSSLGSLVINGQFSEANVFAYQMGSIAVSGPGASLNDPNGVAVFGGSLSITNQAQFSGGVLFAGGTLTVDDTAFVSGGLGNQIGLIHAIDAPGQQSGPPVALYNPITLLFAGSNTTLESDPGTALLLGGTITQQTQGGGSGGLVIGGGTVELAGANNNYSSGTVIQAGTLVLGARGAAGTGAVFFGASADGALTLLAGASANPNGTTTVVTGAGSDTISTANTSVLAFGGSGRLTFYNGAGASTVFGGTGSDTLFGGSAGGEYFGGSRGGNVIVAGIQPTTIIGGGQGGGIVGDLLVANGPVGDVLAAGPGNATLTAGGSTGNNLYFGGAGNSLILAGSGQDTVASASGADTIFGGVGGGTAIFAGTGRDLIVAGGGFDGITAGTGNATVFAGTGPDLFSFVDGRSGGSALISGFKPQTDHLQLSGYAAGTAASVLQNAVSAGGSTVLTLPDNTRITLLGVTGLRAEAFV